MTLEWHEVSDGIYKGKCNGRHVATVLRFAYSATWSIGRRYGGRTVSVEGAKRAAEEAFTQQEVRLEP